MLTVKIILVRPRNPLNVGAAARAMSNFGFRELAVVSPYGPTWRDACSAVGAEDVLASAAVAGSLDQVLSDCHFALATSACQRRNSDREIINLHLLNKKISAITSGKADLKIGLVFGPEKTGLTNKHIAKCNAVLNIPTSENTPSMNLGQAVAVCCYEISKLSGNMREIETGPEDKMPTLAETEIAVELVENVFKELNFQQNMEPETRQNRTRKTLLELTLTRPKLFLLRWMCEQIIARLKK